MSAVLIANKIDVQTSQLDAALRAHFDDAISGISTGWYGVYVYFAEDPTTQQAADATAIVEAHGTLEVTTDKAQIEADGIDTATITCEASQLDGDMQVTYTVWRDYSEYVAPANVPVVSGQVERTLTADQVGSYLAEIARQGEGNYETGYVTVEAQE